MPSEGERVVLRGGAREFGPACRELEKLYRESRGEGSTSSGGNGQLDGEAVGGLKRRSKRSNSKKG